MAPAVSRRSVTAKAGGGPQISACQLCGGHCGTATGVSPCTSVFPVSINPLMLHTNLHVAFAGRTNGRSLGTFQKTNIFAEIGKHWVESYFHFVSSFGERVVPGTL
jgi:hypothetical protein